MYTLVSSGDDVSLCVKRRFLCYVIHFRRLIEIPSFLIYDKLLSLYLTKAFFFFLIEIVSFLYAILMNVGNTQSSSPSLPDSTINLVTEALCMLNFMATVDLKVLQVSAAHETAIWTCFSKLKQMTEMEFVYVIFAENRGKTLSRYRGQSPMVWTQTNRKEKLWLCLHHFLSVVYLVCFFFCWFAGLLGSRRCFSGVSTYYQSSFVVSHLIWFLDWKQKNSLLEFFVTVNWVTVAIIINM